MPPEAPDSNLARSAVELPQLKTVRGPPPEHDELSEISFVPANMNRSRTVPIGEILEDIIYTPREANLRAVPENDCLIRVTKPTRQGQRTKHLHLDHRDLSTKPVFFDRHSYINAVQAFRYRLARATPPCKPSPAFLKELNH